MSPGALDETVVRRHLVALREAVNELRRHHGRSPEELGQDLAELWAVERGLQVCAQNALDIATHVAASQGKDVPDYASAIDALVPIGVLPATSRRAFGRWRGFGTCSCTAIWRWT